MAAYGDVLAALRDFRNELELEIQKEVGSSQEDRGMVAMAARGGTSAFATPLTNIHATGVGIRVRKGNPIAKDFVLKVYVFDKLDLGRATPALTRKFGNIEIDVEHLPIQIAAVKKARSAATRVATHRKKHRPLVGGVSIAPMNEEFVGTLGCFVRRRAHGVEQLFCLSNNHVLTDVNRLPVGSVMVQPGPEVASTSSRNAFAALSESIPIEFPTTRRNVVNRFDAAIAFVADASLVKRKAILGIGRYVPIVSTAVPGMAVIKSGRTTGVTTGTITGTRVNDVQVNYGTRSSPRIAVFNDTIVIVGDGGKPFGDVGDSGSVILDRDSGRPVALLFAVDGHSTTACDLGGVCRQLQVLPI
jgi:hypothetical protein